MDDGDGQGKARQGTSRLYPPILGFIQCGKLQLPLACLQLYCEDVEALPSRRNGM